MAMQDDSSWPEDDVLGQGALAIFRHAFGSTAQYANDWLHAAT